jgi:hypothetical protein
LIVIFLGLNRLRDNMNLMLILNEWWVLVYS